MFGLFKNRKKYNGAVDTKLNNEYQIQTRDNEYFPGMLAYLKLIDGAWDSNMSEDEAAMYIASLYVAGLKKHGFHEVALPVLERLMSVGQFGVNHGTIRFELAHRFLSAVDAARPASATEPEPEAPGTEDWRDRPAIFRK